MKLKLNIKYFFNAKLFCNEIVFLKKGNKRNNLFFINCMTEKMYPARYQHKKEDVKKCQSVYAAKQCKN